MQKKPKNKQTNKQKTNLGSKDSVNRAKTGLENFSPSSLSLILLSPRAPPPSFSSFLFSSSRISSLTSRTRLSSESTLKTKLDLSTVTEEGKGEILNEIYRHYLFCWKSEVDSIVFELTSSAKPEYNMSWSQSQMNKKRDCEIMTYVIELFDLGKSDSYYHYYGKFWKDIFIYNTNIIKLSCTKSELNHIFSFVWKPNIYSL